MIGSVQAVPKGKPARVRPSFGIAGVEVRGFRTASEVSFSPGPLCALVGEADAGKSNLLAAIRAVLDPAAAPLISILGYERETAVMRLWNRELSARAMSGS
jgi:AAA15 family ATPase/GTPase